MPALQPPSRTATPTPIDVLLAPLHLTPDDLTDHPDDSLTADATPHFDSEEDLGGPARTLSTASLFDLVDSSAPATVPTPRRRTAVNGTLADTDLGAIGVAAVASGSGWSSPSRRRPILRDAESSGRDTKGKGRASTTTPTSSRGGGGGERDVIVHKVLKTDSIASISVKYGITPQALRASNRLWPSDPLFLRSQLLIPLDQCTAAAAGAAIAGRLDLEESRAPNGEQGGDLMNWDADAESEAGDIDDGRSSARPARTRPRPGARPKLGEPPPPPPPSGSSQAAVFDGLADSPATTPQPQSRESSEYLTVWDDADPVAAAVMAAALATPKLSGGFAQDDQAMSATPRAAVDSFAASGHRPPLSSEPSSNSNLQSPAPSHDSIASSASSNGRPAGLNGAPLRIERMPASELAFFPAPVASPPLASTSSSEGRRTRANCANPDDSYNNNDDDSSSLFFRPLARQLQQMSIPLPSFLLPSSSSAGTLNMHGRDRGGGGGSSGRIRLPPSPLLLPSTSASSLSGLQTPPDPSGSNGRPQHRRKDSSARSGPPVSLISGSGSKKKGGGGGWGLLDFGAEEDEANQVVQLRQLESYHGSSRIGDPSAGMNGPGRLAFPRRGSSNRTITAADFWNEPAAKGAR